jgi:hypothetical protein
MRDFDIFAYIRRAILKYSAKFAGARMEVTDCWLLNSQVRKCTHCPVILELALHFFSYFDKYNAYRKSVLIQGMCFIFYNFPRDNFPKWFASYT